MQKMTEKEAWLWLAEKWDEPKRDHRWNDNYSSPYIEIGDVDDLDECIGLCNSVDTTWERDLVTTNVADLMEDRLGTYRQRSKETCYWWRDDLVGAADRVYACLFLAAMCDR